MLPLNTISYVDIVLTVNAISAGPSTMKGKLSKQLMETSSTRDHRLPLISQRLVLRTLQGLKCYL